MPTKQEVGERLRLARFKRNRTLKDVAARSGMSATHISEIERGKTSPTIGALQKISRALGERPAHFVEERSVCPATLVRRNERIRGFLVGSDGKTVDLERLTPDCPWGNAHLIHKRSKPGESFHRPPILGELVMVCLDGMYRITVRDESFVIREGDAIQFFLDDGYAIEDISDEGGEIVSIGAYEARMAWRSEPSHRSGLANDDAPIITPRSLFDKHLIAPAHSRVVFDYHPSITSCCHTFEHFR